MRNILPGLSRKGPKTGENKGIEEGTNYHEEKNSSSEVSGITSQKLKETISGDKMEELKYYLKDLVRINRGDDLGVPEITREKSAGKEDLKVEFNGQLSSSLEKILLEIIERFGKKVSLKENSISGIRDFSIGNLKITLFGNQNFSMKISFFNISNKDYENLKYILENIILSDLEAKREYLDYNQITNLLNLQEEDLLFYEKGSLSLSLPTSENTEFDFETYIMSFLSTYYNSSLGLGDSYYIKMMIKLSALELLKKEGIGSSGGEGSYKISFDKNKDKIDIQVEAKHGTIIDHSLIQNFLRPLVDYIKTLNNDTSSTFEVLKSQGVHIEYSPEQGKRELETLYQNEGFVGYDDIKDTIATNIIYPWERYDEYKKHFEENFPNIKNIVPNAVLFEGVPGTGKTTFAKIIGRHLGYPFVYIPINSITSKWYGESEKKLSDILELCGKLGKEHEGVVVLMDEIDEIGANRENAHEATARVTGVLLKKLEGLEQLDNLLLVASTNRKDSMDDALLSRFKENVNFRLPNTRQEVSQILNYYILDLEIDDKTLDKLIDYEMSGRDLKNLAESFAKECTKRYTQNEEYDKNSFFPEYTRSYLQEN